MNILVIIRQKNWLFYSKSYHFRMKHMGKIACFAHFLISMVPNLLIFWYEAYKY